MNIVQPPPLSPELIARFKTIVGEKYAVTDAADIAQRRKAAVIGRPCRDIPASRAAENILGYTIANDVTARDQQRQDGQWTRAKGHDTFCPVGPWIVTDIDPSDLDIRTEVNGEVRQHSRTSMMIHDIGAIVEWISAVMTLLPGDLIPTGTPQGVGPVVAGETMEVTVEGIGTLSNPVA